MILLSKEEIYVTIILPRRYDNWHLEKPTNL